MDNEERILQEVKGQYTITLPVQVIRMLQWKKGDKIQVLIDKGDIILRKKQG